MKAILKNYRQAPRKVRLVADTIRGKKVSRACMILKSIDKKSSEPIYKLLMNAVSNAKQKGESMDELSVGTITVDEGIKLRRFRPRARGMAFRINKRSSTIKLELKK